MSVASEITRLQNAKADIKTSIENKGVTVGDGTIDTFASKIDEISSGVDINDYYDLTKRTSGSFVNYIKKIPFIDTSSYTSMDYMFQYYSNLTTIPKINTSKVTTVLSMFNQCSNLTSLPELDFSAVKNLSAFVANCNKLTDLGGFQNLGKGYTIKTVNYSNYTLSLSYSGVLTHDSLMNVINNLYDLASNEKSTQTVQLGSTNLAKLTAEEIAIATNKGWTVS